MQKDGSLHIVLFSDFILSSTSGVQFQYSEKSLLRYFDITDLSHAFFPSLLFFEQFTLSCDIAAITFCSQIFSERFDRLSGDDFRTDGSLDGDFKLLSGNEFSQFHTKFPAEIVSIIPGD